jgi:hypothetical protein
MGVGGQRHAPAAFTPGKDPVTIVQEAGWAPGPVWIGAENLAPTGIRSPYFPARSESLYRLSYPGPQSVDKLTDKSTCTFIRFLTCLIVFTFGTVLFNIGPIVTTRAG